MDRKGFLASVGTMCAGSCLCVSWLNRLYGQEAPKETPPPAAPPEPRAVKRMEFVDKWVKRFFDVLDQNLDDATLRKIMMTNGKVCYREWIKETNQTIRPVTLEQLSAWAKNHAADGTMRVEGNTIYMTYTSAAETGLPSKEGECLCSVVESKPAGMSPTFCHCSVGYVKEMHELMLARTVDVELTDSVLRGGKRCSFTITVL